MKLPFFFSLFNIFLFYTVLVGAGYYAKHYWIEPLSKQVVNLKQDNTKLRATNVKLVTQVLSCKRQIQDFDPNRPGFTPIDLVAKDISQLDDLKAEVERIEKLKAEVEKLAK